jgi:hypothetical protein
MERKRRKKKKRYEVENRPPSRLLGEGRGKNPPNKKPKSIPKSNANRPAKKEKKWGKKVWQSHDFKNKKKKCLPCQQTGGFCPPVADE